MKYNVGDIVKVPWGQLAIITEYFPSSIQTLHYYRVRFLGRTGGQMFIEKDLVPLLEGACQP
jgi:hypothetical protein